MVYLLHFDRPLHHAQHYLGYAENVDARTERHLIGSNARFVHVMVKEHGISFTVARVWEGDRKKERALKRQKNGRDLCPICRSCKNSK